MVSCVEAKTGAEVWRERAGALEREVAELKLKLLDGERRLLEALVEERKKVKKAGELYEKARARPAARYSARSAPAGLRVSSSSL